MIKDDDEAIFEKGNAKWCGNVTALVRRETEQKLIYGGFEIYCDTIICSLLRM